MQRRGVYVTWNLKDHPRSRHTLNLVYPQQGERQADKKGRALVHLRWMLPASQDSAHEIEHG